MPQSLRRLFTTKILWKKFEDAMSEDYKYLTISSSTTQVKVLANINSVLQSMERNITDYALPNINIEIEDHETYSKEVEEELNVSVAKEYLLAIHTLNQEQS